MPRNGSGTFTRNYDFTADAAAGAPTNVISSSKMDTEFDDISTALTASIAKDGQTTPTANLPMGGYRHTGVGDGSAVTDYAALGQVQKQSYLYAAAGGSADAITATFTPTITALTNGMTLKVRAGSANATTTPTFSPDGLTARTIVKDNGASLAAGDIAGSGHDILLSYDLANTRWLLLNPKVQLSAAIDLNSLTTDSTGGAQADLLPFVDASDSNASNKVLVSDFLKNALGGVTADTTLGATADQLIMLDASETDTPNRATVNQVLANAITNQTEDTSPDAANDLLLIYDNSASGLKKVKPQNLRVQEYLLIAASDETTTITTGTAKVTFRMPYAFKVTAVRASLSTVSSSGVVTVDINEGGTTILSTKLTIDASEKTSTTAATPAVISDADLADDAEITIDIDTAGTGAKGLKVTLIGYRV